MSGCLAQLWVLLLSSVACGPTASPSGKEDETSNENKAACEPQQAAPNPLPGVKPEQRTAAYWIERHPSPDQPLMDESQITRHNLSLQRQIEGEPIGRANLDTAPDSAFIQKQVETRIRYMREKLDAGTYVDVNGGSLQGKELATFEVHTSFPKLTPEDRRAGEAITVHCGPRADGLYKTPVDEAFDRNRCSTVRKGERVQLLARWGESLWLARTGYTMGWIEADAKLEPYAKPTSEDAQSPPQLTYRNLVSEAFRYHGKPYGWGGKGGAQDCSRFLMDVFEPFGIKLPRHSGRQALAGSYSVSLEGVTNPKERKVLLRQAAKDGVVLIHFPGHIMLYLGQDDAGEPMAIHAFSEYFARCPADGSDITMRADRVAVSDLSLGKNSSRTSFLERITTLTVIGSPPSHGMRGAATIRPAVQAFEPWTKLTKGRARDCQDTLRAAIFRSPAPPDTHSNARVIATLDQNPGFAELFLQDPEGKWHKPPTESLGGPPYTFVTTLEKPSKGRWAALVADGVFVISCERFNVRRDPIEPVEHSAENPRTAGAWRDTWKWETDTENLYAAFIERLFDEPKESDETWPDLHTLLRDPKRNLLYNHLGQNEDDELELGPDCADLPYFLRAYFAWKTNLPFGYRRCSRGKAGTPPACNELRTNREALFTAPPTEDPSLEAVEESQKVLERNNALRPVDAFKIFSRRLASGVHSASARTYPKADATDVYPVALKRTSLKPGTVFADPYGHLLVVAKWWPQTAADYGVLVGADAQPDGTIGRRRFWRGSFLFTPKTDDVGAGFKLWRPLVQNKEDEVELIALNNEELAKTSSFPRFSLQQYKVTREGFYAQMESLINPRPLDPVAYMTTLVDALDESVKRRMVSVENGVAFMEENGWAVVDMPSGHDIFETKGPWEDYATPARDLRLLISLDAVLGFPKQVAQAPERFGVQKKDAQATEKKLRETLGLLLAARRYTYKKSDGKPNELRLADVAQRAKAFEMAYNPNDCVEVRWGAPLKSEERSSCDRRAPEPQQQKMAKYRTWFEARERPAR